MRHMLLAYKKLSFSQVYKLYKSLQQYYHSEYAKPTHSQLDVPALLADDSDMDLTSTDETVGDKTDKEEADAPLHPSELQSVTPPPPADGGCCVFAHLPPLPLPLPFPLPLFSQRRRRPQQRAAVTETGRVLPGKTGETPTNQHRLSAVAPPPHP